MLSLKDKEWGEFQIGSLFDVKIGKAIDANKVDLRTGNTAYISRKENNNGLDGFLDYKQYYLNNQYPVITIGNETAEPFVQTFPFFTGTKVNILSPKESLSLSALLFAAQSIKMNKSKYSYTFTINSTRLKKQNILLPVSDSGKPDWKFMENYIREREQLKTDEYAAYVNKILDEIGNVENVPSLKEKDWKPFRFGEIFTQIKRGKRLKKSDHIMGRQPYISSSAINNGVDGFIANFQGVRKFDNCLTIANSGSVGKAFYHKYELIASDHVTQLKNPKFDQYVYLFLTPIVSRLAEKYSFNREINDKRIKKEVLLLPVNDCGRPDWDYMGQYARGITQRQIKAYLDSYVCYEVLA